MVALPLLLQILISCKSCMYLLPPLSHHLICQLTFMELFFNHKTLQQIHFRKDTTWLWAHWTRARQAMWNLKNSIWNIPKFPTEANKPQLNITLSDWTELNWNVTKMLFKSWLWEEGVLCTCLTSFVPILIKKRKRLKNIESRGRRSRVSPQREE